MSEFYKALGASKSGRIQLALMDMRKPFRNATQDHAPQGGLKSQVQHFSRS